MASFAPEWVVSDASERIAAGRKKVKHSAPFKQFSSFSSDDLPTDLHCISTSFSLAADCVLRALQATTKDTPHQTKIDTPKLLQLRDASIERSLSNKELSKRKPRSFTRNTPASSAAALDVRMNGTRLILCCAGNLVLAEITPGPHVAASDVPTPSDSMGSVLVDAQKLVSRAIHQLENSRRRADLRLQYQSKLEFEWIQNPYDSMYVPEVPTQRVYDPIWDESPTWDTICRPKLEEIWKTGIGHSVVYDTHWETRYGRLVSLLSETDRPHLIITVAPYLQAFGKELRGPKRMTMESNEQRSVLYTGTPEERKSLRLLYFAGLGKRHARANVIITNYECFLQDYLHFCQIPFCKVIVDDGLSWMAAKGDPKLGNVFDNLFATADHHVGMAGSYAWDFGQETIPDATIKETARVGLTCRHRIVTASTFTLRYRQHTELVSVPALMELLYPNFFNVVKEEWDRSKIATDAQSMQHFLKLAARSIVVHQKGSEDLSILALQALTGKLMAADRSSDPAIPTVVSDDAFSGSSRRVSNLWLGPPQKSWLRYELAQANLDRITQFVKLSMYGGPVCDEITTASSLTSSGANGQVAGTMAFRLAVRCSKPFGSESGLRQHIAAHHSPPGTWLCRTCTVDCFTSHARTHHERTCGQPQPGSGNDGPGTAGATPTVGQGAGKKSGTGKKKTKTTPSAPDTKDADGSAPMPGYRGVWTNKEGKHFVKTEGKRHEEDGKVVLFESSDDAAKAYDRLMKEKKDDKVELNFKEDGSRIVYETAMVGPNGLGGGAADVVPALSVINIKELPPDVKPLLRDPRQTSRTGGNSKRHIYAYRGVCRQARKGHDRWQSQISYCGVNHYLGTFDSEWDAAAVYAWAHLILYGEEATRQAQREGEEAAKAYEQEQRDIAAGKIPDPATVKAEKKKAAAKKKEKADPDAPKKKRQTKTKEGGPAEKKARTTKGDKETMAPILAKAVGKTTNLAAQEQFQLHSDDVMIELTSKRLKVARDTAYGASAQSEPIELEDCIRPCIPYRNFGTLPKVGRAMLVGLCPTTYGWDMQDFLASRSMRSEQDSMAALQLLAVEYDEDGVNEKFVTVMQGTHCVLGNASPLTQRMYQELKLGPIPLGGSVGRLDCHIGGVPESCGEHAACILVTETEETYDEFSIRCLSDDDTVTLNGRRIYVSDGDLELKHQDICSVGARVFAFLCE